MWHTHTHNAAISSYSCETCLVCFDSWLFCSVLVQCCIFSLQSYRESQELQTYCVHIDSKDFPSSSDHKTSERLVLLSPQTPGDLFSFSCELSSEWALIKGFYISQGPGRGWRRCTAQRTVKVCGGTSPGTEEPWNPDHHSFTNPALRVSSSLWREALNTTLMEYQYHTNREGSIAKLPPRPRMSENSTLNEIKV